MHAEQQTVSTVQSMIAAPGDWGSCESGSFSLKLLQKVKLPFSSPWIIPFCQWSCITLDELFRIDGFEVLLSHLCNPGWFAVFLAPHTRIFQNNPEGIALCNCSSSLVTLIRNTLHSSSLPLLSLFPKLNTALAVFLLSWF